MLAPMPATRQHRIAASTGLTAALALLALAGAVAVVRAQAPLAACFGAASRDPLHPCNNRSLRLAVMPSPRAAGDEPNASCNSFRREAGLSVCTFGVLPPQATRNIALVGDSHASHWRGPLAAIAREQGWRGLSLTRKSCPFSKATKLTPEPTRSHCIRWVEALPSFLRAHPEIDTIFVVALAGGKVVVPPGRTMLQAKVNGYRRAWKVLPDTVKHIVVIRDTPRIDRVTVACIDKAISARRPAGTQCARPRELAIGPDPQVDAARGANSERVQVIDLTRAMCSTQLCFPVIGGALVYKDLHHLSLVFADTLAPQLSRAIAAAMTTWG